MEIRFPGTPDLADHRSRGFNRFGLERDALFLGGRFYDEEHLVLVLASQREREARA